MRNNCSRKIMHGCVKIVREVSSKKLSHQSLKLQLINWLSSLIIFLYWMTKLNLCGRSWGGIRSDSWIQISYILYYKYFNFQIFYFHYRFIDLFIKLFFPINDYPDYSKNELQSTAFQLKQWISKWESIFNTIYIYIFGILEGEPAPT